MLYTMGTCKQVECLSASNIPFQGSIASGGLNLFHMEKLKNLNVAFGFANSPL